MSLSKGTLNVSGESDFFFYCDPSSSLQEALFESAVDYYSSHSKRVRRKKNRYPQQPAPLPPGSGPITGRPLRNEGWIVRYEVILSQSAMKPKVYIFNHSKLAPRSTRWQHLQSFEWR